MQKQLSKHSLLVLSLSILLVISMCLAVTFAAFQKSESITGTVSFSGGIEFTVNSTSTQLDSTYDIDFSIDLETNTITKSNSLDSIEISASNAPFYWKATLTLSSATYIQFNTASSAVTFGSVTETTPRTTTVMTWNLGSGNAVTGVSLDVDSLISSLPIIIHHAAIGDSAVTDANAATNGLLQATLAVQASYSPIA